MKRTSAQTGMPALVGLLLVFRRRSARAAGLDQAASLRFGDVEVRPATHDVLREGRPVQLRPKEFELLDTHVGELRRKLEQDPGQPKYILTVRKTGYRLNAG